ncbi:MAG: hypothetical protein HYW07_20355 [Candidatus Latescibacteria bacterium]|nr:hypothetical protein [Candidatus Latescibacterota bacterium]
MRTTEKARPVLQETVPLFETGDLPETLAGHGPDTRLADLLAYHGHRKQIMEPSSTAAAATRCAVE